MNPKNSMKFGSRIKLGALAATLLLPACATVSMPDYAADRHPANPDAMQTPAPPASNALDTYRPAPPRNKMPAAPAQSSSHVEDGNSEQETVEEPEEENHDQH